MVTRLEAGDPSHIGGYRLLGELGAGGMGRVLLGVGADGRLVAIKQVHAHLVTEEDFLPRFENWNFGWLDVPEVIRKAHTILEFPMVDRDPLERWTFGRITLLGDAAHPMFPRGGNGGAQAILDAQSLARHLAQASGNWPAGLQTYEAERRPATTQVVLQNRTAPPNLVVDVVEKMTGGRKFNSIDEVIPPDQLRQIFADYQKVAGYHVDIVNKPR